MSISSLSVDDWDQIFAEQSLMFVGKKGKKECTGKEVEKEMKTPRSCSHQLSCTYNPKRGFLYSSWFNQIIHHSPGWGRMAYRDQPWTRPGTAPGITTPSWRWFFLLCDKPPNRCKDWGLASINANPRQSRDSCPRALTLNLMPFSTVRAQILQAALLGWIFILSLPATWPWARCFTSQASVASSLKWCW